MDSDTDGIVLCEVSRRDRPCCHRRAHTAARCARTGRRCTNAPAARPSRAVCSAASLTSLRCDHGWNAWFAPLRLTHNYIRRSAVGSEIERVLYRWRSSGTTTSAMIFISLKMYCRLKAVLSGQWCPWTVRSASVGRIAAEAHSLLCAESAKRVRRDNLFYKQKQLTKAVCHGALGGTAAALH